MKPRLWQQLCMLSLLPAISGYALAAGFKVNEYSTTALGAANSAGAAQANDATTVFSNPAGMTQLDGQQVTGNLNFISLDVEFSNNGSVDAIGQPIAGDSGGNATPLLEVPAFYWAAPIDDKLAVGFGVSVPFGLTTDYDSDFYGRYGALKSDLLTVDLNPSIAYQLNDNFSVGFGVSLRYADVLLSNAVEYGAVCFDAVGGAAAAAGADAAGQAAAINASCVANGLAPQAVDGTVELAGDDWGFGYNIGVLYHTDNLRVGAHFRSKVKFDLEGDADFNNPAVVNAVLGASGAFVDTKITADLTLPETFSLSAVYDINSEWSIMADYLYTKWSRFETLEVEFDNPAQPNLVEEENWNDVARYAVGAEYNHSEEWTFRGGIAFDEGAVPEEFARPRIPDSDRYVFAAGLSWTANPNWVVNAAYNYLIADDSELQTAGNYGETLIGDYEDTTVHILSFGVTYKFN